MTTYTESDFDGDHAWLTARYAAALDRVGGDKARHLDAITIFMFGATWGRGHAEQRPRPRPLTPDDITDEFAATVAKVLGERGNGWVPFHYMREAMVAALAPARPEGAEEIEALLGHRDGPLAEAPDADHAAVADFLASKGVRVVGSES